MEHKIDYNHENTVVSTPSYSEIEYTNDGKLMWHKIGEKFSDVSISFDGEYWALGTTSASYDGYEIYYYENQKWVKIHDA